MDNLEQGYDYIDQIDPEKFYYPEEIVQLGGCMTPESGWTTEKGIICEVVMFLTKDGRHRISGAQLLEWNERCCEHNAVGQYN